MNVDYLITAWAQWTDTKLVSVRGIPVDVWEPRFIKFHSHSPSAIWVTAKQFYFPASMTLDSIDCDVWAICIPIGGKDLYDGSGASLAPPRQSRRKLKLPYSSDSEPIRKIT
jgi:hypothetical protein